MKKIDKVLENYKRNFMEHHCPEFIKNGYGACEKCWNREDCE